MPPKKEEKKKSNTLPRGSVATQQGGTVAVQQKPSGPPITVKKGLLTKKGKRGLGSKQTWVEIQINPSQFHYYDKEGGKLVKTMPISPEGSVEITPAKKGAWGFSYNELERPWPFSVGSEKEQNQWAGAFQYAIICAPKTQKSSSMYKDVYALHDAGQQVKAALAIKDRPYTGDGQVFMKESYVSVAGQRLMELSTAIMEVQQSRAEQPGGSFWNETVVFYNDLIPLCKTGVAALTRKLTAHNTIEKFKALYKETVFLVQQGKTRAAEKKWSEADAVASELFADDIYKTEKKDALITDVLVFKSEYEKDKSNLEKLIFESRKRDAAVVAELRTDAVERALYSLDRALVVSVRPYNTGKGFLTPVHGRQAEQAFQRAQAIFNRFLQDLKSGEGGGGGEDQHANFIRDTRRRLWQAEGTVLVLKDRIGLHQIITEFVDAIEELESLVYQGAIADAEEGWKRADAAAKKALKYVDTLNKSSGSEGEEESAMSSLMSSASTRSSSPDDRAKGFVVREDVDAFNAFYKVTQGRIRTLFLEAKKISDSADREKGTGVSLVTSALTWLSFSLNCAKRPWTFRIQPQQQQQQLSNPRYHECTWLNLNGVSWNDVATASACADSLERTLQVVVVYFAYDGFDKFRKEWETTLRASRETIRQLQIRVVAQEESEKFLIKSLAVDYFLQAHLLEDAKNAWAACDALANCILDRADFRTPGDGNTYLPDIQAFNVLYKTRSDKIKAALSTAIQRKNYVAVKPLFSSLLLGGAGGGGGGGGGGGPFSSSLDSPTSTTPISPFPTSQSLDSKLSSGGGGGGGIPPASPSHQQGTRPNPFASTTASASPRKPTISGEPGSPGSPGRGREDSEDQGVGVGGGDSGLTRTASASSADLEQETTSQPTASLTISSDGGGAEKKSSSSGGGINPFGSSGSGGGEELTPTQKKSVNPFGGGGDAPVTEKASVNPFGAPSREESGGRPSVAPVSNPFAAASSRPAAAANPFGGPTTTTSSKPNNPFG